MRNLLKRTRRIDRKINRTVGGQTTPEVIETVIETSWDYRKLAAVLIIGIATTGIVWQVANTVAFSEFMLEEAAQQAGFSLFQCANAIKATDDPMPVWDFCKAEIAKAREIGLKAQDYTLKFGWLQPLNWWSYQIYWQGYLQNVDGQEHLLKILAEGLANKAVYVRMCDQYTYETVTLQFKESDVKGLGAALDDYSAKDYAIKSIYNTKIGNAWFTVAILQKTTVTTAPCPV